MFKACLSQILLILSVSVNPLWADQTATDFSKFKDFANSLKSSSLNAMKQFNPGENFKGYTETPSQSAYYTGIDVEKSNLAAASTEALKQDAGGKTVVDNFGKNRFEINKDNSAIQQAMRIEAESYAITHGISNDNVHCEAHSTTSCTPTFRQEICSQSRQLPEQQCSKKRVVSVESENITQSIAVVVWVHKNFKGYITVNLVTGQMTNALSGSLSSRITLHHACSALSVGIQSIHNNGDRATWVGVAGLPNCQNNGLLTLNITHSFKRDYPLQIALTAQAVSSAYEGAEHWDNDCASFEAKTGEGFCYVKEEICTDKTNPHIINGLPVTRDCWETTTTYACNSAKADECRNQQERGCLQLSSRCARMDLNECALYEQVYQCPEKTCQPEIVCTHDVFCADGECVDKVATQNDNFGKDVATLAATNAVGREYSATPASLFGGHVAQCKIWALDLIDCCSDKGWGKAIHLLNCRDEDKALGQAKLNYVVHYLGKFCATEVAGVCLEYKHSYCVFDSKMARIIQEEGRLKQLNSQALGNAEHPTCAGMSVGELQQLDMDKIEFLKPVYPYQTGEPLEAAGIVGDIRPDFPNADKSLDEITRRIQKKASQS